MSDPLCPAQVVRGEGVEPFEVRYRAPPSTIFFIRVDTYTDVVSIAHAPFPTIEMPITPFVLTSERIGLAHLPYPMLSYSELFLQRAALRHSPPSVRLLTAVVGSLPLSPSGGMALSGGWTSLAAIAIYVFFLVGSPHGLDNRLLPFLYERLLWNPLVVSRNSPTILQADRYYTDIPPRT